MNRALKEWIESLTSSQVVGVDLGSAAVKVVQAARVDGRVVLRSCAVGKIETEGDAAALLKRLLAEAGITATQAALGLSSSEVVVKPFQCPPMPRKEIIAAIRLEAESAILSCHSIKDMAIDWQMLPSVSKESLRGVLAVVPKTALANPAQTAKAAGLKPVVVDVEGLALWNAYWALMGSLDSQPKTVLLINVGAGKTNLVIARGADELVLVRNFQMSAGVPASARHQEWLNEISDSLGYASSAGLQGVDAAVLTGGGADDKIVSSLKATLSVPVTLWNPFQQLLRKGQAAQMEEAAGPLFSIAIGLALRRLA